MSNLNDYIVETTELTGSTVFDNTIEPEIVEIILSGPQGPAGPEGPPGAAGSGASLVYTQAVEAGTWTILHGLGRVPHGVTLYIDGDIADTDTHVDDTNAVLTFASPATGEAHIW